MLRIEDVFVVFCAGTPLERIALRGVNFSLNDGCVMSVFGNNGSGKSTLMRFLAGHIFSNFGKIRYDKADISGQSLSERSKLFSSIFYDQDIGSAGNLTVAENLAIASMHHQERSLLYQAFDPEMKEVFYEQLRELDFMRMEMLIDEKAYKLSKPQRHVLSMLIAIIKESKILLIDEHTRGLDKESSELLLDVTRKIIRSKKMMAVIAVNEPNFALDVSDKILIMNHGEVALDVNRGLNSEYDKKICDAISAFDVTNIAKLRNCFHDLV